MLARAGVAPLMALWALLSALPARGVLFDAVGDPGHNTNAPAGMLADSGWAFEGRFGGFLGAVVAPHYFLTARHIGGDTNTPFVLDGTNYFPDAMNDDAGSDLRLWHVPATLPRYAPTYLGAGETGCPLIAIGRGTQRGDAVVSDGLTNGWAWGTADGVQRWGSNSVSEVVTSGGTDYLYATFDHGAGPDECHLSIGDSGGSAFILVDGKWQLAGIHYAVDGSYSYTNSGGFDAAIYDGYGLYIGGGTNWAPITNHAPGGFYSTRVSSRYAWLTNVIANFDSDADGMPDWWEVLYTNSVQALVATNDVDGDGADNLSEWLARTDPTNRASMFGVLDVRDTNGVVRLTFEGWSDRFYRVYTQGELSVSASWNPAHSVSFSGADGPTSWSDTNSPSVNVRFYRLGVGMEPF